MLKLTYTEADVRLECLPVALEDFVSQRTVLAVRLGQSAIVQPGWASFLLPAGLFALDRLETAARKEAPEAIELCVADDEFVEVSVRGSWLAIDADTCDGVFAATLSPHCEMLISQLWERSRALARCARE